MKDRKFLRSMAALLESVPAIGVMRKDVARRLRAIAESVPDDQDTSKMTKVYDPFVVEIVKTEALPKGVFIFTVPPPLEGMPPVLTGSAIAGDLHGNPQGVGWVHCHSDDFDAFERLALDIQSGKAKAKT